MKNFIAIAFIALLSMGSSCKKIPDGCIDDSIKTNNFCKDKFDPVCGCDHKTYGNACYAKREGVTYYTMGECK